MTKTQHWIGLLRGIGGATHAKMPMAALRRACEDAGLDEVRTVLATGNLVFQSPLPEEDLAATLRRVVAGFGLDNPTFLRRAAALRQVLVLNPRPRRSGQALCWCCSSTTRPRLTASRPSPRMAAPNPCRSMAARCSSTIWTMSGDQN